VAFGLLGLLAGFLASLPRSRFLAMVIIASFAGLTGDYLASVLQFTGSALVLRDFTTPAILFAGVSAWTMAALWATRKPDSPLGFLAGVPHRLWSRVVYSLLTALVIALGISHLPEHWAASTARATGRASSPNIVLIVWDTARADHFSSYGYLRNTTPNVDKFAQRGVLFENAISASSWTLPAMASVFTGLLPHQHGAYTDRASEPRTLAQILGSGGYETAGFNANPFYGIRLWGLGRGFETYTDSSGSLGYSLDATRIGRVLVEPFSEEWFHRSRFDQFTAHQLNEEVYRWFDHRSDRPFFLFLNYNDAHDPYEAPLPHSHLYGRASDEAKHLQNTAALGRFYLPPGERESLIADYDNCLSYIDSQVGELLQFLERSPDWSNTYVIITADHGDGFGEHGTYTHGWNLYREVLHVPLIIAGPGIPQGVRVRDMATTPQIFSTALEIAGMKRAVLRHNSLSRLWTPGYVPDNPDEPTISEMVDKDASPPSRGLISITTREWQLIYRPDQKRNGLYNWPTDPLEQRNLAGLLENQALLEHLKSSLISIIERSYRPWRDTESLQAFSVSDFSPELEATKTIPTPPGGPFLPLEAGAEQTLFVPNPSIPRSMSKIPDKDLLESLPYDAR
jgi:arylsulfatase A-like enzyme